MIASLLFFIGQHTFILHRTTYSIPLTSVLGFRQIKARKKELYDFILIRDESENMSYNRNDTKKRNYITVQAPNPRKQIRRNHLLFLQAGSPELK